jgi:hypothetical protein
MYAFGVSEANSDFFEINGRNNPGQGILQLTIEPAAAGQQFLIDLFVGTDDLKQMHLNGSPYQPMIGAKTHLLFEAVAEDTSVIQVQIDGGGKWNFYSCEITAAK